MISKQLSMIYKYSLALIIILAQSDQMVDSLRIPTELKQKLFISVSSEMNIIICGGINMAKVVAKCGIKKDSGYLYFIDKDGNVARVQMARTGVKVSKKKEVVEKTGIKKEAGFLYFIDKNGNVACAKMARGGQKRKKKAVKKAVKKKAVKKAVKKKAVKKAVKKKAVKKAVKKKVVKKKR
jgi:hypothetical protein